jgi:hypothetical protein
MADTLDAGTMSNLTELRRRYETVRVTEDSKDTIIEACFSYNVVELDFTDSISWA